MWRVERGFNNNGVFDNNGFLITMGFKITGLPAQHLPGAEGMMKTRI